MLELCVRLLVAGGMLCFAGNFPVFPWAVAWKLAIGIAVSAVLIWQYEEKKGLSPLSRATLAGTDAFVIGLLLATFHQAETLGFLVLAPCLYAVARFQAKPMILAPLASSALFAAHALIDHTLFPSIPLMIQAVGVLLFGLLPLVQEKSPVPSNPEGVPKNLEALNADGHLQLRESYRKLRDAYRDLERRSRKDRIAAELNEVRNCAREHFYPRLSAKLHGLLGIQNLAIYTLNQNGKTMKVRTALGAFPDGAIESTLAIDINQAPGRIKHAFEKSLKALLSDERKLQVYNVLLNDHGRVIGMLCLTEPDSERLEEIAKVAEELAPAIAAIIAEYNARESIQKKLMRSEIMYEVAAISHTTRDTGAVAQKISRDMKETLALDHVAVYTFDEGDIEKSGSEGADLKLIEKMTFENGTGIEGWLASGAPEIYVHDATGEEHANVKAGSFGIFPLKKLQKLLGFMTVATQRPGGIDQAELDTIRVVSAELAATFEKMDPVDGQMPAKQFYEMVKNASNGFLVSIEPIRRFHAKHVGTDALDKPLAKFRKKISGKIPQSGGMYAKPEGDIVVYLPLKTLAEATLWANDVTATASLIGVSAPDGRKIPLGVRARVANLNPQENEVMRRVQLTEKQSGTFAR